MRLFILLLSCLLLLPTCNSRTVTLSAPAPPPRPRPLPVIPEKKVPEINLSEFRTLYWDGDIFSVRFSSESSLFMSPKNWMPGVKPWGGKWKLEGRTLHVWEAVDTPRRFHHWKVTLDQNMEGQAEGDMSGYVRLERFKP